MITLIQVVSGQPCPANPSKIVAGLDAQNTNVMLQQLAKTAKSNCPAPKLAQFCERICANAAAGQSLNKGLVAQEKKDDKKQRKEKEQKEREQKQQKEKQQKERQQRQKEKEKERQQQKEREQRDREQKQRQKAEQQKAAGGKLKRPQSASKNKKPAQQKAQDQENAPAPQVQPQVQERAPAPAQKKQKETGGALTKMAAGQQELPGRKGAGQEEEIRMGRRKQTVTGGVPLAGQLGTKQIDTAKQFFQNICQNAAPLAKNIEFVSDDIESMSQQFKTWRKQYNDAREKRLGELRITEEALAPLYKQLAEIEQKIREERGKIQSSKTQIAKNQAQIRDLLYSTVTVK